MGRLAMAANNCYRVTYHFEVSGKRASDTFQDNVVAASQDYNTISTVLSNNGKTNNGKGTLVIESIGHAGSAGGVLS